MTDKHADCMHAEMPHYKILVTALKLLKAPGCVYDVWRAQAKHWPRSKLDCDRRPLQTHMDTRTHTHSHTHNNCVAFTLTRPRNKPPTRAWTMVMLMAHTFSTSSHNTIMLRCGNGCALPQTITRQPPSPCHLPALFTPGLHYEVQRKSSLAICKNLQGRDAVHVLPYPHKEDFLGGEGEWTKGGETEQMHHCRRDKMFSIKYLKTLLLCPY